MKLDATEPNGEVATVGERRKKELSKDDMMWDSEVCEFTNCQYI